MNKEMGFVQTVAIGQRLTTRCMGGSRGAFSDLNIEKTFVR